MYSVPDTAVAVGFPIRTSMDQSPFAAPHGFSQRTTSFIASQRQGIHQMPLSRLIALISQCPVIRHGFKKRRRTPARAGKGITGIGKTSCKDLPLHPLPGPIAGSHYRERACGQARPRHARDTCFSKHAPKPWHGKSNPFFTMSKINPRQPSPAGKTCIYGGRPPTHLVAASDLRPPAPRGAHEHLVEPDGIEPTTSCLQSRRSPN
jgi:hypothetical protein